ncbi:50S ribosomal protein L25 [Candidatus Zixiibacteriota bacterium]|nr:50S ribosomal protein L25 [candidate division Zixibacteria bacterium]
MKEIRLSAQLRDGVGKEVSRKTRRTGFVPGILYGPETKPLSVSVNNGDLATMIRRQGRLNMLIDLDVADGKKARKVIIRELQRDPVTGDYFHIDFYQVSMKKKLHLSAPVYLTGSSVGVKTSGGIMEHVTREIEIACLPSDIPDRIEIDVSALEIGDSVHVRDLKIEKVEILTDKDQTIATVVPPTIIKAEAAAAAPAEGEVPAEGAAPAEGEAAAGAAGAEAGKAAGAEAGKKPEEAKGGKPGGKPEKK